MPSSRHLKVKVCGLTLLSQIQTLATTADYLGVIFAPASPRFVALDTFKKWAPEFSPLLINKLVGVFQNTPIETVMSIAPLLSFLQLHGDEDEFYVERLRTALQGTGLNTKIIKAISASSAESIDQSYAYQGLVDYILFDSGKGGSGKHFNWDLTLHYAGSCPFFLAGGIGVDSLERLDLFTHPQLHAVDVNSQLESSVGVKDIIQTENFIQKLNQE